jgi:hypothetical protein
MSEEKIDPRIEQLWAEEIMRRLKELDEGQVQAIPWPEVRDSIVARRPNRHSRHHNKH